MLPLRVPIIAQARRGGLFGFAAYNAGPAPVQRWMTYPMTVVDTIIKAVAPAIPDRVIAAHHADLLSCAINGRMPDDGRLFLFLGGLIGGGWGAKRGEDGMSATIAINDGDTHNSPSEQTEAKYPMLRGTTRDQVTQKRRPFMRFFACGLDLSDDPPDAAVPEAVARGSEPYLVVGAIAGG